MKALVVYESFFGNTEKVARTIGAALGLAETKIVTAATVQLEQVQGLDLLIVGSPTRAFSASPETKAFLKRLPADTLKGTKVAAFDTRMKIDEKVPGILRILSRIFGFAAEPIARGLVRKGGMQVLEPAGFTVEKSEGPLHEGELERASAWVAGIK